MDANDAVHGIRDLSANECWRAIRSAEIGRLAVIIRDHPDIFPITYVVDHGTVVFRTAQGSKLDGVLSGHPVAFEVDGYDAGSNHAWSAVIKGRAERLQNIEDILDSAMLPLFPWQEGEKNNFIRIVPSEITGRRFRIAPGARKQSISERAVE
jgi:uncharacterized protein